MHIAAVAGPDDAAAHPSAIEFVVAGISSQPFQRTLEAAVAKDNPARLAFAFDDRKVASSAPRPDAANMTFRLGIAATAAAALTGQESAGLLARNPGQNPHLRLLDSAANGFCIVTFGADAVRAEFHSIAPETGETVRVAHLEAPAWEAGAPARMDDARIEGTPLFPAGLYRD
jgi:hypothetical protein